MQYDDNNLLDFVIVIGVDSATIEKFRTSWTSIRNNEVLETPRFCSVFITQHRHLTADGIVET